MSDPFAVFEGMVKGVIWGKEKGDFAPESIDVNTRYLKVMNELGISGGKLILPLVEHGTNIGIYGDSHLVKNDERLWRTSKPCDGFLVSVNGRVGVAYMPADCPIVIMTGTRRGESMLVALHCGWRGLLRGIVDKAISLMASLGVERKNMRALATPGIGPCCFEVGPEIMDSFKKNFPDHRFRGRSKGANQPTINMLRLIMDLLIDADISKFTIMSGGCTKCNVNHFWSHRRGDTERNIVAAALS